MYSWIRAVGGLLICLVGFGQTPASPLAFEVASIKTALPITAEGLRSGQLHIGTKIDGARADFGGVSLLNLIAQAYRVKNYQVSGPDWLNAARFDIIAKLPEGATVDQVPEMLQTLLADRFKLTLRREAKTFDVYALVVGKDGPKLTPKPADYDPAGQKGGPRPITMESYAAMVSPGLDRPVVDLTGLKGQYMVDSMAILRIVVEQQARSMRDARASSSTPADAASDPDSANAFAIVQKVGLKLEPRKLPLPQLVVEHIEKTPTEN